MKWINSGTNSEYTCFNYINEKENDNLLGGIIVVKDKINWYCDSSRGPADDVGQAKRAVETLAKVAK